MTSDLKTVGFVGFGAMPRRMAARLGKASRTVIAFDPEQTVGTIDGVEMTPSPAELAKRVDAILVCVPDDAALHASVLGDNGALAGASADQLLVNFSSVSAGASLAIAAAAAAKRVRYVETPMSGSTPQAESGSLVFLAGGREGDVRAIAPILDALGRKTVHVGDVGRAAVAKLIVNGLMAAGTAALAEGLGYALRSGLDRAQMIDLFLDLPLISEHHKHKLAMVRDHAYQPEFPTRLMVKDLGLLLDDGLKNGGSLPITAAAAQLFAIADREHANEDYSSLIGVTEIASTRLTG